MMKRLAMHAFLWACLFLSSTGSLQAAPSGLFSVETIEELYELDSYPNGGPILDGDVVLVQGYWDKDDGGGGLFRYDAKSSQNPIYDYASYFKAGYSSSYDGMIAKSKLKKVGRWFRQWDRGKLNLRWFGGAPGDRADCSKAFNVALQYAQFEVAGWGTRAAATPFNNRVHTQPGKTLFLPTGEYYFRSPIQTIVSGVVIEGEGSAHATRILILRYRSDDDIKVTGISNERFGFFRYHTNQIHNAGGGLKNLSIEVHPAYRFDANVITLNALAKSPSPAPLLSKWSAENVIITMGRKARRAFYLEGEAVKEGQPLRIQDVLLVNCWMEGGSIPGQTILAKNVAGLHLMGGRMDAGLSKSNTVVPGVFLGGAQGCAHVRLDGVDLTQGTIEVDKKSRFLRVDCPYGKLQIHDGDDSDHENLQIVMTHILNPRKDKIQPDCPDGYKCYWD